MRRRRFLHASGVAACASLAGCSALGKTKHLHNPKREDDETETFWVFREDGAELLNVGVDYGDVTESRYRPLEYHTWHRQGTTVESLRVEFRFGRPAGEVPPEVYLDTYDGSPDPKIHFRDDSDAGATILEIPDVGPVGRGSLRFDFLVDPPDWTPEDVRVEIREVLSEDGQFGDRYVAEVDGTVPFPDGGPSPGTDQ